MKYIVFLLMITITGYSQTIDRNNVIARQKLQYSGGNPDSNKLAVSVDANGIFKWVYFTDFQDSVNTGIYDTTTANVVVTQAIRITGATFASDTIVSIGSGGEVSKCFATCDTIQYILDNLGGAQLWEYGSGGLRPINNNGNLFLSSQATSLESITQFSIDSTFFSLDFSNISGAGGGIGCSQLAYDTALFLSSTKAILLDPDNNITTNVGIGTATPTEKLHVAGTSLFTDTLTYQNGTQANGYVLTSDASGNATWQDPTAYGEMGFGDSLRTIAITQNVFSVVTNTANDLWSTAAVDLHNVTYSGDSLIVDSAGTYQVNIQLSMDGTNGSVIRLGVFLNGVLACSCTGYQELSSNRIIQLNYINIDQLNANDVLQVVVTNTANGDDVDVVGGKITINKIR